MILNEGLYFGREIIGDEKINPGTSQPFYLGVESLSTTKCLLF